jgi:hypothetical protein
MATRGDLSQHSTLFYQLAFGGLFLALVLSGAKSMMYGSTNDIKLLAVAAVGITAVLALDKWYWILLPVLQTAGIEASGLPFSPFELGQIAVITMYFFRKGLRNSEERPIRISGVVLASFPLVFWMFGIFCINPCGMYIFGSSMLGGRFYMQILLAWLTLLIASSWRFDERNCRVLFFCLLCGSVINIVNTVLSEATWQYVGEERAVAYEFIGFSTLFLLMFARYRIPEIISKFWRIAIVGISIAFVLYSGKRIRAGHVVLAPIIRVFLTGRDKVATIFCGLLAALFLSVFVMGDKANIYEVPNSVKRTLAMFVPYFKDDVRNTGLKDEFRVTMRAYATEQIKQSPWVGLKGFAINRTELLMVKNSMFVTKEHYGQVVARNWHSTFHAYAADFGLPALLFFVLFILMELREMIKECKKCLPIAGTYSSTVMMYYSFLFILSCFTFYSFGHTATTTQNSFLFISMFIAVRNGVRRADSPKKADQFLAATTQDAPL